MTAANGSERRTALVTGASSGIGYELARVFAREGYDLVLVARSEGRLQEIARRFAARHGVAATALPKDLSLPTAPIEIYRALAEQAIKVDVLVNNAGFTEYGSFLETELEHELSMLQVNVVALTHLTKLFLPGMVETGWGKILNLGSTASFQPGPLMAVYYASKAYVLSFSEALAGELKGTGVSVTALCPGPTMTGFQARGRMEGSRLLSVRPLVLDARQVARAGYRGLMKGKRVVVPGFFNWLGTELVRVTPRKVAADAIGWAQNRPSF